MLSKNFDSHRSLQQTFYIHTEDLIFLIFRCILHKQRYYQTVWETFYQEKKLIWIVMSSVFSSWFLHTVIQTNSLTVAVLSPVTHHQYSHFPIPFLLEEYGPSLPLLEKRTSTHTIFLTPLFSSFPCHIHNLQNTCNFCFWKNFFSIFR